MKLIISGGGARISYLLGIKKYIEEKNIPIDEYSGSSSGSIFIVLMACKIRNNEIIKEYSKLIDDKTIFNNYKLDIVKKYLHKILPNNCHILCTNKVNISYSYFKFPFIRNKIVNKFKSKNHLIEIILASASFPFFINKNLFYKYNNKLLLDGFFSNNTPILEKNNSENQIIVKTYFRSIYDLDIFLYKKLSKQMTNLGYNHMKNFIENGETISNLMISNNKYNTKLFLIFLLILLFFNILKNIFYKKILQ